MAQSPAKFQRFRSIGLAAALGGLQLSPVLGRERLAPVLQGAAAFSSGAFLACIAMRLTCTRCRAEKPASDFYSRKDRPGAYLSGCIACRSASAKAKRPERWAAVERLTADEILARYAFDPESGKFTGRINGKRVAADRATGYVRLPLCGMHVQGHRAAWFLTYGSWPEAQLDHADHDRANNRPGNLALAPGCANARNMSMSRRNSSGVTGVSWSAARQRWVAQISTKTDAGQRKNVMLGHFEEFADAVRVRRDAERAFGYHPNHGAPRREAQP